MADTKKTELATFAGGCFWCTEAIFKRLIGVLSVTSGYANAGVDNPSYQQVSSGSTGAAEAIQVEFDPAIVSYETLLKVFWHLHDPTTLNQQGADIGTQYRSAILYQSEVQKKTAEESKQKIEEEEVYDKPIVTEIAPLKNFYKAGEEHQDFYDNNKSPMYCRLVIDPKIQKLLKEFNDMVKDEYR